MKRNILIKAPIFSASGYGAHARDIILAIWESRQFNISAIPTGWGSNSSAPDLTVETERALEFMVQNPLHNSKDSIYLQIGLPNEFETLGEVNIGVTAGLESTGIPPGWAEKCNQMDLLVVPSEFIKATFLQARVTCDIMVVHEGVDCNLFNTKEDSSAELLDLPDLGTKFNFLCGGQWLYGAIEEDRKQIAYLIDNLASMYGDDGAEVGLYLKTYSANLSTPDFYYTKKRLVDLLNGRKLKVCLLHGSMGDSTMSQLYNDPKINAFITLTSGEGWGRYLAEAVASGLPVLAPRWSGHMDFIDPGVSCLFDIVLREIPQSVVQQGLFQRGMKWGFVERPEVINKINYFIANYAQFREKACNYSTVFKEKFSKNVTYANLVRYLVSCGKLKDIPLRLVKIPE